LNSKQAAGVDAKRSLVLADYAGNISVTALMNSRQKFPLSVPHRVDRPR